MRTGSALLLSLVFVPVFALPGLAQDNRRPTKAPAAKVFAAKAPTPKKPNTKAAKIAKPRPEAVAPSWI